MLARLTGKGHSGYIMYISDLYLLSIGICVIIYCIVPIFGTPLI